MNHTRWILVLTGLASVHGLPAAASEGGQQTRQSSTLSFHESSKRAFDRSGKHVTHRVLADGALMAEYHGSVGAVTVARLGADGRIETLCTTDELAAQAFMAGLDVDDRQQVELHLEEER